MTNKFKHTLTSQDIILRQDDDESTWLEENGGAYVPLVRVKNTVLPVTSVTSMNLEIGQDFLPQLTISFDDDDFHFRETDFVEGLDIVTIFIGAPLDEVNEPIKNDYIIRFIDSSPGSASVTLECELYVPELYKGSNRAFDDISINVLEQVAKDCKLGFSTNIQTSDDSMQWIQYHNNLDFIHEVAQHSYITENSSIRMFVDQFANLTVVDLSESLNASPNHTLEINPVSADALEEPIDLVLTSNKLDTDNPAKITSYTPTNSYGAQSKRFVTQFNYKSLDYNDYTTVTETTGPELKVQQDNSSTFTEASSENVHERFNVAPAIHLNNRQTIQGTQLRLRLDWAIQSLYMMQVVPVDIYNISKKSYQESNETTVNLDDLTDQEPETESSTVKKNELLSGNCLILEMSFVYYKSTSNDSNSRLKQTLKVHKIS